MNEAISFEMQLDRLRTRTMLIGACGAAGCAIAWFAGPRTFFAGYLVAWMFWLGISLGSLIFLMIHATTGGAWGMVLRPVCQSATDALLVVTLAFLPIVLGIELLYPWSISAAVALDEKLLAKAGYLNVSGFVVRSAIYLLLWNVLAWAISGRAQSSEIVAIDRRRSIVAGPGLIVYGFSMTLASIDWLMSLEPHWYSTMYGVICMVVQALSGLAFAIAATSMLAKHRPWNQVVGSSEFRDLGTLLFIAAMFWAYVEFMQFLLIWSGNLPEEVVYYQIRSQPGWIALAVAALVLSFVLPCCVLLSRALKSHPRSLALVASSALTGSAVVWYWLAVPPFGAAGTSGVQALVAFAAIGGFWIARFAGCLALRAERPLAEPLPAGASDDRSRYAAH